ncbi:MAG: aminotransferase class V-fold PLP-dependent enzyme [Gammaproteobacteria bacterium]|nr:aminotransferase class V-fold PLP-dependent enzyme [Gammaproteobacteria bacterium]
MTESINNDEFPHIAQLTYLNHAAVAPWPRCVATAVSEFAEQNTQVGAQHYPRWMGTEIKLRQRLARLINAPSPDDIALLKNTSEALSVLAYGIDWQAGDNIVTSDQEFPSNRIVWESLRQLGVELREVDLNSAVTPEQALINAMNSNTRLLTISSIQYASGLKMDLAPLGHHCRANEVLFCVDAIQSLGAIPFDAQAIEADFVMADGHKWMLGPEGLALFYCRAELREQLKLHQYGWHMVEAIGDYDTKTWAPANSARRFECGSPNMLAIHALNAAMGLILATGVEAIERLLLERSEHMMQIINDTPKLTLLTSAEPGRYGGIVTFRAEGVNQQTLYQALMKEKVICAQRGGGIRFSPHFYTPLAQLDLAFNKVDEIIISPRSL